MYTAILLLSLLFLVFYLSGDIAANSFKAEGENQNISEQQSQQDLMVYLTSQLRRVQKNYSKAPEKYRSSPYGVTGMLQNDCAVFYYNFPLVHQIISQYSVKLYPDKISSYVDTFGVVTDSMSKNEDQVALTIPSDTLGRKQLKNVLASGNWILDRNSELSFNYKQLVLEALPFCESISVHIHSELQQANQDSFFNRVQAALNFVQFIPYGIPDFDTGHNFFGGLALPPESFVLNYSDCDSKSIFFASLLAHLIGSEYIVLIECRVADTGEQPENHMMVGVSGLGLTSGQPITYNEMDYVIIETTSPCVIGDWHWDTFDCQEIIPLNA